jgi:hypothetical protein
MDRSVCMNVVEYCDNTSMSFHIKFYSKGDPLEISVFQNSTVNIFQPYDI